MALLTQSPVTFAIRSMIVSGRANLAIIWLIIFLLLVVAELMTMGLTTIWFAGGALGGAAAAAFGAPLWLQILIFTLLSLVLLFITRPIAVKYFNKDRTKTNTESLIGQIAVVRDEINNLQGTGRATVGAMEWTARSVTGEVIPVGEMVIVKEISGVKLMVETVQSGEVTD